MIQRKLFFLLCCLAGLIPVLHAQNQPAFDPAYRFVQSRNLVQDKNFYLLTLFEQDPVLHKALLHNSNLQQHLRHGEQGDKITKQCQAAACFAASLEFSAQHVTEIGEALKQLYDSEPIFREALQKHLRPSGVFMRLASLPEEQMLVKRWEEEAAGLNYILTAYTRYTKNTRFRYPRIDSAAFDVLSAGYIRSVKELWVQHRQRKNPSALFFTPTLDFAMDLLALNKKDHAARHEPLAATNQKAYQQIKKIQWSDFPYSSILVLGAGPSDDQPISATCKERCRTGAALFKQHKAPFIIVSGGYVHPFGTRHNEAMEMKKYLTDSCNIPETAIIAEPQARHTTTNIRNANRILYRNGFPMDKKVLCTSSGPHLFYVNSIAFEKVCNRDLGYLPLKNVQLLDATSLLYEPVPECLHEDPLDPLDP